MTKRMDDIRFELDTEGRTHFQEEMEIIYILSGRAGIVLMGKNALLKAEDFIVLNSMDYHDMYKEAGCHSLSFLITISLLRESGIGLVFCCSALQPEKSEYMDLIRGKLAVIYKNYLENGQERKSFILSEVFGILAILGEQFALEKAESLQEHHVAISRMRDILIDLHSHYMENLTLEKLAADHFMSQAYLSRQFERQLGLHFTDYLKKLRIQKAEQLLLMTGKSVTEVAQDVGYANSNTFIIHFRDIYGVTPGVYRRQSEHVVSEKNRIYQNSTENVYYVNLLKYAFREEMNEPLHKKLEETKTIRAEISHALQTDLKLSCKAVCFGYASNYYRSVNRQNLIRVMEEIESSYVFVNGVFDDAMSVYHEEANGKPWYQFTYLDPVLEEICSHDAVPWIELGRIPGDLIVDKKNIFQGGYVQLPDDLNKWKKLLEVTFCHYREMYGEEISKWKFSVFPALYAAYGIFTMDSWLAFYECTFRAIRKNIPGACITGGTFDTVMLRQDGEDVVLQFLDYCTLHDCMPDELSLQSFTVDYSGIPRKELEENIQGKDENYFMEPAPPSKDRHKLRSDGLFIKEILAKRNMGKLPLSILYWDASMWSNDLGSDTCYKSAYLVHTIMDNRELITFLNSTQITDFYPEGRKNVPLFRGNQGMFTAQGIPKAAYYAYILLSKMGPVLIDQEEGYCITTDPDRQKVQILLYHYCHYNLDVHIGKELPRQEQMTIDRYYFFEDQGMMNFQLYLSGLQAGRYRVERYTISRDGGSSYDYWRRIGAPDKLTPSQKKMIMDNSHPAYQYQERMIAEQEETLLAETLDSHCVILITLDKIEQAE